MFSSAGHRLESERAHVECTQARKNILKSVIEDIH